MAGTPGPPLGSRSPWPPCWHLRIALAANLRQVLLVVVQLDPEQRRDVEFAEGGVKAAPSPAVVVEGVHPGDRRGAESRERRERASKVPSPGPDQRPGSTQGQRGKSSAMSASRRGCQTSASTAARWSVTSRADHSPGIAGTFGSARPAAADARRVGVDASASRSTRCSGVTMPVRRARRGTPVATPRSIRPG